MPRLTRLHRTPQASRHSVPLRARSDIMRISRAHGARRVRIFGSFARGDQTPDSDLDLLVDLPLSVSLLDISSLKEHLQKRLGRRVDIVTEDGLSPYLRERVLREALPL